MRTENCEDCNGTGNSHYENRVAFDDNGNPIESWVGKPIEVLGPPKTCDVCKGHGIVSKRMMSAYKTEQLANRYRGTKAAKTCHLCKGKGRVIPVVLEEKCYSCAETGKVPVYEPGMVFDEDFDLTKYMSVNFQNAFWDTVEITVERQNRNQVWAEAFLGLGILSVTDYGKAWEGTDEAIIERVLERKESTQFCKVADRETRQITSKVVILMNRNGYSLLAEKAPVIGGMLPPTYTDDVLLREVK